MGFQPARSESCPKCTPSSNASTGGATAAAGFACPALIGCARFIDRAEADARCRELEWELRRKINPFTCGGPFLHYQTGFDAARLFDWCLDAGLEPPGVTSDSRIWADWWSTHRDHITDAQRATVWEALDHVRFYRVTESDASATCQLVATQHLEEDPRGVGHYGYYRYVGCTPYMLARRSETADDLCHQLFVDHLARQGTYMNEVSTPTSWERQDADPFADDEEEANRGWWHYELEFDVERRGLELFGGQAIYPGQEVFVFLRRHWRLELYDPGFWRWSLTHAKSCGRPIAAFATLAAADECRTKLETEARRTPALFRFGPPHEWSTVHPTAIYGMLSEIAPIDFTSLWEDYKASDAMWCRWWDEYAPTMTQGQLETVWSLYDNLKFYEVVAVEYRE